MAVQVLAVPAAQAMIIRHDVPDAEYVVADEDWPALVDLIERGDCIGTLIHESYLLTVAHCAVDLDAGGTLRVNGVDHIVAEVVLHPSWRDLDEYDIALARFEEPVVGVDPIPIYRGSDELGAVITLVGRGVTATGLVGEREAESDGKLRRATNVVSDVNGHFLEVVFEQAGEDGVTPLEGVGASGDSGCPALLDVGGMRFVAGLNSYGEGGGGGIGVGEYGSRDYQTRVSRYLAWIDGVMESAPDETGDTSSDTGDTSSDTGATSSDTSSESGDAEAEGDPNDGCACSTGDRGSPFGALCLLLAALASPRTRRLRALGETL